MDEFRQALINKLLNYNCQGTLVELGAGQYTEDLSKYYNVWSVSENAAKIDLKINYIFAPITKGVFDERRLKELPGYYNLLLISNEIGRRSFFVYREWFLRDVPVFIILNGDEYITDIAKELKRQLTIYGVEDKKFAVI